MSAYLTLADRSAEITVSGKNPCFDSLSSKRAAHVLAAAHWRLDFAVTVGAFRNLHLTAIGQRQ
jgi:hypothetical protein